MTKLQEILTL